MNDEDDSLKQLGVDDDDAHEIDDLDDDPLVAGEKKKPKKDLEGDDSIDELAEIEEGILPEDSFDDVEPEDLW